MNRAVTFLLKCAGVWVALMIGQVLGGLLTGLIAPHGSNVMGHDGPLSAAMALPVVAALFALILGGLASQIRRPGQTKFLVLFTVLYVVGTVQSQIEAVYFNAYLKLSTATTLGALAGDAVKTAIAVGAATLFWRGPGSASEPVGGLWWKLPLLSLLYVIIYFGAGALIAWQGAAVRQYYAQGAHINIGQLAVLQIFRGAIWATVALLLTQTLTGGRWLRAAFTGGAFSIFMASQLLYPISFMPWDVRKFHIMEVGSSNFLYGLICVLILMLGVKALPSAADRP